MRRFSVLAACLFVALRAIAADAPSSPATARVKSLRITILSTMLADTARETSYLGEWGFAALVEADGHRILFDTGAHADVVRRNAEARGLDLATVPEVVLSHSHDDHLGGFLPLRNALREKTPAALARAHVGEGMFAERVLRGTGAPANPMIVFKPEYERGGGAFVVHAKAVQLYPGIWLTGPVARKHPERNFPAGIQLVTPAGRVDDTLPEDLALVCDTEAGLVILTGCGHAGAINIVEHARATVRPARVHALIGGLHVFNASEETLAWTAGKLREFGVEHLLGAHCTGVETLFRFRRDLGLDRAHAVVAAVGAGFELGRGIDAGVIAK